MCLCIQCDEISFDVYPLCCFQPAGEEIVPENGNGASAKIFRFYPEFAAAGLGADTHAVIDWVKNLFINSRGQNALQLGNHARNRAAATYMVDMLAEVFQIASLQETKPDVNFIAGHSHYFKKFITDYSGGTL